MKQRNLTTDSLFCSADETTLKTIIRSNPGFVLLREGTIIGKWSYANLPSKELFVKNMTEEQTLKIDNKSPVLVVYSSTLSVIVLLLLINSHYSEKNGLNRKWIFAYTLIDNTNY